MFKYCFIKEWNATVDAGIEHCDVAMHHSTRNLPFLQIIEKDKYYN